MKCYDEGDSIEGKRVACECRKHSDWRVDARTGKHRGMKSTLYDAYCIIEQQYEWVEKTS